MAKDMPDTNLRFVLLGHVSESGAVNLRFPVLPDGFLIRSFLTEHFLKGSQYIEDLFAIPCVNLDPATVLERLDQ